MSVSGCCGHDSNDGLGLDVLVVDVRGFRVCELWTLSLLMHLDVVLDCWPSTCVQCSCRGKGIEAMVMLKIVSSVGQS